MTDETVGQRIKRLRENLGLTQESLGQRVQLSVQSIRGIELGRVRPPRDDLSRLAISLRVPIEYLRDGDGDEVASFAVDEFNDYGQATEFIQYAYDKLSVTSFRNQQVARDDLLRLKLEFIRTDLTDASIDEEIEIFRLPKDDA